MSVRSGFLVAGFAVVMAAGLIAPARAWAGDDAKKGMTVCRMTYSLKGWSAFYKTSKGQGTITCDNGQSLKVKVKATGGGITFGKSEIVDGTGKFTEVKSIAELLGSYAQSEAHAGAGKSADAQALTKGEVSLTLAGTGHGVDVGFAFGKFTIDRM